MNLEESKSFVEKMEKNNKQKRNVLVGFIFCLFLIILLVGIIIYLKHVDAQTLKVFLDDNQVKFSDSFFSQNGNVTYVNIDELSDILGYSYQKGEYKNYTEDSNSCYLRTQYEITSMVADENRVTKYILNDKEKDNEDDDVDITDDNEEAVSSDLILVDEETGEQSINIVVNSKNEATEIIYIEEPIKYINNELYVSTKDVAKVFNIVFNNSNENRVYIYSLNTLMMSSKQYAENLGYKKISNIYENLTAIASNMIVVGDGENYGVVDATTGKELISLKYDKVVYMQNTDEFLVTAEKTAGIVSKNGETIIRPAEYKNISVLDEVNKLYLVEKDDKYGVLNGEGDTIVYSEYDSIGIENSKEFQKENIRNYYLLFEELIPVNLNGKTGLIDIEGNEIFKPTYTLGYVANSDNTDENEDDDENSSSNKTTNSNTTKTNTTNTTNTVNSNTVKIDEHDSVLTISEETGIKGIVLKNYQDLYGIYDVKSKKTIPCSFSKIYSRTKSGKTTYYLEYNGQEIELLEYLNESGFFTDTSSSENNIQNNVE